MKTRDFFFFFFFVFFFFVFFFEFLQFFSSHFENTVYVLIAVETKSHKEETVIEAVCLRYRSYTG